MLPFKNRLLKRKDFEKVKKSGLFFSEGNVSVKILENNLMETRVGFVAGIKFSKKSVERNKIKRQLREIFRLKLKKIKKGFDMIVVARKRENEKIKSEELKKSIDRVLEKSFLIRDN